MGSGTITVGKVVYWTSGGAWSKTRANAESTSKGLLGIAGAGTTNAADGIVLFGFVKSSSHGFTVGAPLYLSDSATTGLMTNTPPSDSGDVVRVVGYAVDSNVIYFNPDPTYVTIS